MILYHYTAREYLGNIARTGLCRGEVPVTPHAADCLNAVWLTTDPSPSGHGLTDGRPLTEAEKRSLGAPLDAPLRFPNKRAIQFRVIIPTSDRRLIHWPKWGKGRLTQEWYNTLDRTGGGKSRSWWLYWGTIAPSMLQATDLETGAPLMGWLQQDGRPQA